MVVFSPFVLLLCTLWELCARFLIDILLFTDQKKKTVVKNSLQKQQLNRTMRRKEKGLGRG